MTINAPSSLNSTPQEEIVTNDQGGKNSAISTRYDLIPANVVFLLAEVLAEGAKKYAPNNWKKVEAEDHFNHMMNHLYRYRIGHINREELGHALCRMVMWVHQELT